MDEQQNVVTCSVCGDQLTEDHPDLLCHACVDSWERDVDCPW